MARRSLGTLTLDLVTRLGLYESGLDKAGRLSAKTANQIKKDFNKIKDQVKIASAAAVAALTAMTVNTIRTATEVSRLAALSGTTTSDFQKYSAGAKALGIEQDKLGDIFKDTSDKVGDFLQTGAGPLADFFENIAPQVGVTAEQFRNLSGPESLELYVSSLEKANLSQSEMTFFMEAIASDATLLLPLLQDNAAGFKAFGDEAERAGGILSDETIASAQEMQTVLFLLNQGSIGFQQNVTSGLLPVLRDLAVEFVDVSSTGSLAADAGQYLGNILKFLAAGATGVYAAFVLAGKSIATLTAALGAADLDQSDLLFPGGALVKIAKNVDEVKATFNTGAEDIAQTAEDLGAVLNNIWDAGTGSEASSNTEKRVQELTAFLTKMRKAAANANEGIAADQFKATEEIKKTIEALDLQVATLGKTATEAQLYELALKGADEQQLALIESHLQAIETFEKSTEAQKAYKDLLLELRTDEEKVTDQLRERLAVLDEIKNLSTEDRDAAAGRAVGAATTEAPNVTGDLEESRQELQLWYLEQNNLLDEFQQERADLEAVWNEERLNLHREYQERLTEIETQEEEKRREKTLEGYATLLEAAQEYYAGVEGSEAAYARAALSVGQALLDDKKRQALTSIAADTQEAAMGAYAALADIPYVGPTLGAAAAAAVYLAGAAAAAKVTGIAHEGIDAIPQSGSWYLEKGERVTTQETSAKLDSTLDRVLANQSKGNANGMQNTFTINAMGSGDERENKKSAAQIAREVNRIIGMTQRYG